MSYDNAMSLPGRLLIMAYAVAGYAIFLAVFVVFVLWSLGWLLPQTIDSGALVALAHGSTSAMLIDLGLILLFGVQHSGMARRAFKRIVIHLISAPAERPTFVMLSNIALALIIVLWQPLPQPLWKVTGGAANVLLAINLLGWLFLVAATFMISHFELFGLQQAWSNFRARAPQAPEFTTRFAYAFVRHPMMTGLLLGLWLVPVMSVGHLVLSLGFSAYILVGTLFEERDLIHYLGSAYIRYRAHVPRFFPLPGRSAASVDEATDSY